MATTAAKKAPAKKKAPARKSPLQTAARDIESEISKTFNREVKELQRMVNAIQTDLRKLVAAVEKAAAKKAPAKKAPAKRPAAKKAPARKAPAKR